MDEIDLLGDLGKLQSTFPQRRKGAQKIVYSPWKTAITPKRVVFTPIQCNQCEEPPCVPACPVGATFKLPNGIVVTDWDKCESIGTCVTACPYGTRFLDERYDSKVDKCDFCLNRIEKGLMPACVEACEANVRLFGDMTAPEGEFAEYLKRTDMMYRKPELKIKTSLQHVPSRHATKGGPL